ncbi:MAG: T9SS type A sorting domain-containing protein, partial [Salibacteraceae bacterium]
FNENIHCLSHQIVEGGIGHTGLLTPAKVKDWKTSFTSGKTAFDQAKYLYVSTIDGGDTYGLLNTVQSTNTQTAWELRTDLMSSSPLSLEVIFEVIEEDFLSNALLHDVLMVNPHAVRDEEVMHKLENKTTPMPAYMINTLLGIYKVQTQKDVLEAEMANEMETMATAANFLYSHWTSDSLNPDNDSVLFIAQQQNTAISDWKAVEFQISRGNMEEANTLLSAIPSKYDLTGWSLTNNIAKTAYFNHFMNVVQANPAEVYQPTSAQIGALQEMANDSDNYAGRMAQNQVLWAQGKTYWPVIAEEPSYKKASKNPREPRAVESLPMVEVYPNPANDFITLRGVNVTDDLETVIQVINSSGLVVINKTENMSFNQVVSLKTQDLASGHYFVLIYQDNQLLQKLSFEVVH